MTKLQWSGVGNVGGVQDPATAQRSARLFPNDGARGSGASSPMRHHPPGIDSMAAASTGLHFASEQPPSFIGRMIGNISGLSKIMDAETVLVGMQPAVAITLVELGLTLPGVSTALNVERGMQLLQARVKSA